MRYFDPERSRPGLPPDVAALIDEVGAERVGIQLVNLSPTESRHLIVQAGAFAEHQFTGVTFAEGDRDEVAKSGYRWLRAERVSSEKKIALDAAHFAVELPPSSCIRLEAGMRRFANQPGYGLPWDGEKGR